jgi:hypothetical protein
MSKGRRRKCFKKEYLHKKRGGEEPETHIH